MRSTGYSLLRYAAEILGEAVVDPCGPRRAGVFVDLAIATTNGIVGVRGLAPGDLSAETRLPLTAEIVEEVTPKT